MTEIENIAHLEETIEQLQKFRVYLMDKLAKSDCQKASLTLNECDQEIRSKKQTLRRLRNRIYERNNRRNK